jgi:macrodomain Ter protein organizer (MatP/YcbG family)
MQLILVKIKCHIKWKYLIQKFHDIVIVISTCYKIKDYGENVYAFFIEICM